MIRLYVIRFVITSVFKTGPEAETGNILGHGSIWFDRVKPGSIIWFNIFLVCKYKNNISKHDA